LEEVDHQPEGSEVQAASKHGIERRAIRKGVKSSGIIF
jgi:hypothetical protein